MKTIKNLVQLMIASLFISTSAFAQSKYEVDISSGQKVIIENLLGKIMVKNNTASKMVIETDKYGELPEKAKGMKEIYGGSIDNTDIGISVKKTGDMILVSGASKRSEDATYTFYIPTGTSVEIDYTSPFGFEDIEVNGFKGELEVTMLNAGIELENVSGPMTIHTINGDITVDFMNVTQESPSSITSINGEVDVLVPANTTADLNLSTMHGEIYTNCDIKIDKKDDPKEPDMVMIGGHSKTKGKLNGGGVELTLSSINGSIYLRKK